MQLRIVLFALICGYGCGAPTFPDEQSDVQAITGGSADLGDPNVVALVSGLPFCSGTLVGPRLVLTAGHCVADNTMPFSVYFGSSQSTDPGTTIRALASFAHPFYSPDGLDNDVGLVVLAADPPASAVPKPLATQPITDAQIGATLRLVGFGETMGIGIPFAKNQGLTIIDSYSDTKIAFHANPSQTCSGDSGGPAFMDVGGVEELVGVTSSGDPACMTSAHDMRVDIYTSTFIEPYAAATGVGAAKLGHPCIADENCASGMCVSSAGGATSYCTQTCTAASDCPSLLTCAVGICQDESNSIGGLGAACAVDFDCASGICGTVSTGGAGVCTTACSDDPTLLLTCPDNMQCEALTSVVESSFTGCVVADQGCSTTSGGGSVGAAMFALIGLRLRRRRR